MNDKKKRIIIYILIVLIIISSFIGIVGYIYSVKSNNNSNELNDGIVNNSNSTITQSKIIYTDLKLSKEELDDIIKFFNNHNGQLMANTSDGKEITIFKINREDKFSYDFHYDYDEIEKVIYVSLIDDNGKRYIGSIDLNEKLLNVKIIKMIDDNSNYFNSGPAYITKIDNYIYISSRGIYKYDIKNDVLEEMNIFSNRRYIWSKKYNSYLLYQLDNDIYMLNVKDNQSSKILSDSDLGYIYNDKLVYLDEKYKTNNSLGIYSLYDFNTKNSIEISKNIGTGTLDKEYIIPFGDDLFSFYNLSLYKYNGKDIEKVYTFKCSDIHNVFDECTNDDILIYSFSKISKNIILLNIGDGYYNYNLKFDLDKGKIIPGSDIESSNDLYIDADFDIVEELYINK